VWRVRDKDEETWSESNMIDYVSHTHTTLLVLLPPLSSHLGKIAAELVQLL